MIVLGISAYYHDSAAALVRDGVILAAAQEERFTRKKHDPGFPAQAVKWCLESAGVNPEDVDHVAFYDKPFLKFERLLETYLAFAPHGFTSFRAAMPIWIGEKLFQKDLLLKELKAIDENLAETKKLLFAEHHFSHAASAFYPSPFEEAAVLTMDGVGEWATTSAGTGRGSELTLEKEIHFTFRIRSGYFIPLLRITRGLKSTPVSTKSWGSRLMASRNTLKKYLIT
jgi:carbamoyltransferase